MGILYLVQTVSKRIGIYAFGPPAAGNLQHTRDLSHCSNDCLGHCSGRKGMVFQQPGDELS